MESQNISKTVKLTEHVNDHMQNFHQKQGKENYFFKKKFVPDSTKQFEKQIILSKLSSLQNYSNPIPFIIKKESSKGAIGPGKDSSSKQTIDKNIGKNLQNGFSFQTGKMTVPSTSKRENKSLSTKKFSFDKAQMLKAQIFSKSFAQNQKHVKKRTSIEPPKKIITSNDLMVDIEKKLTFILKNQEEGNISPKKARKKLSKLLNSYKQNFNENPNLLNNDCFQQLNLFVTEQTREVDEVCQREKVVSENKGVQTMVLDFDMANFIAIFKDFSLDLLREGSKVEFKLKNLIEYFQKRGFYFESIDFEMQKLLKSFSDTIQKQLIFEEVIKILEEENIKIDDFLQNSYDRVMQQLIAEREQQLAEDDYIDFQEEEEINNQNSEEINISDVRSGMDNSNYESCSKKLKMSINLKDLGKIKKSNRTPQGFHQEFMGMAAEFSQSWRDQIEKEKKKHN